LFSKDKAIYDSVNGENVIDLLLHTDQSLSAELYINDSDLFNGACQTSSSLVTATQWNWVGFKFDYDGFRTSVEIWLNDVNQLEYLSDGGVFLEDSSSTSSSWLLMRMDSDNNNPTPTDAFHGFMYWFYMWNTAQATLGNEITSSCTGDCSICSIENGQCLWTVERD